MYKSQPKRKKIRLPVISYGMGNAFSITIATAERHPWFQLHPLLAETFTDLIIQTAQKQQTDIFAWCIMPEHAHLLIQTPEIIIFIQTIKGKLTPAARKFNPAQKLWQRSFYDHGLRKEESTQKVARYIWNNPVRAGIVKNPADYPWSGSLVWPEWRNFMF